jgi:hypothetical protein
VFAQSVIDIGAAVGIYFGVAGIRLLKVRFPEGELPLIGPTSVVSPRVKMPTSSRSKEFVPPISHDDPDARAVLAELDRILSSRFFKDAIRGSQFLEYVVRYKLEGHTDPIKERTIGTEVFHRPVGYQTGDDSVVRVQASEVRRRLEQFYQAEGPGAAVRIELPLGSYSPIFRTSQEHESPKHSDAIKPAPFDEQHESARLSWKPWPALAVLVVLLCLAVGVTILVRNYSPGSRAAAAATTSGADAALTSFWKKPSSSNGIVVAFTNPEFIVSGSGQLLPYSGSAIGERGSVAEVSSGPTQRGGTSAGGRGEPLYFENGFTGTGEVFAASSLAGMLRGMDIKMDLFRSKALQASEFSDHDIVFLGSPSWNQILDKVKLPKRFVFHNPQSLWQGEIEDTAAQSPATRIYKIVRDSTTGVIESDYGVFQVFPGPSSGHRIMLLAGLTTTGTQGAAAFATSPDGLSQVRKLLGLTSRPNEPLPEYFSCLLRVEAAGGLDALQVVPVTCSTEP